MRIVSSFEIRWKSSMAPVPATISVFSLTPSAGPSKDPAPAPPPPDMPAELTIDFWIWVRVLRRASSSASRSSVLRSASRSISERTMARRRSRSLCSSYPSDPYLREAQSPTSR